jgi:hypothetical protein
MHDYAYKVELWKRAYRAFGEFKEICHEIAGTKRGQRRKKRSQPGRLRCGCEPHGHKCLVAEGGCGRCASHCICPPLKR